MHRRVLGLVGLTILCSSTASAQDIEWRAAAAPTAQASSAPVVRLGRPEALIKAEYTPVGVPPSSGLIARGQIPDGVPPPPPPPGVAIATPAPGEEAFNCGIATTKPGGAGFFSRLCDHCKRGFSDVGASAGNIFQPGPGGTMFHSDNKFCIISPVSNPFYFEDPRALTELRPIFMWLHTP